MITEHLMRPGSGSIRFRSDIPVSVTDDIRALVDENDSGVGASIVVTKVRVDPVSVGDTATLAAALYTGAITARPSRLSLEFAGVSSWLDTYFDSAITRSSGTPTQWVGDLVANGITAGTITGGSNVSRTFPAHSATRRECLDAWAGLAGVEYRVNPDFTVDTAAASTLFVSPPEVVVTRRSEGPDGTYRGVEGGLLDQALTQLGPNIATKAVALAEGEGAAIAKGTATRSVNLKTPAGGTPTIITVLSAPSEESGNANTLASNFLNLQGMRRQVNVGSKTYGLPRFVRPGDEVYVWDPEAGLFDTTNQIQFRGETIFPVKVRLLSYTWPIESGYGVYVRSNAASPTYIDVTDWVEWEDGSETWWTVGDWSPPSYGPTNRSAPEIEERVAGDVGPGRILLTRSTAMSIANGGGGTQITWGTSESYVSEIGGTYKAAAANIITIPTGLGGDYLVTLSGEFATNATGIRELFINIGSNTTAAAAGELSAIYATQPAHGTIPDRLIANGVVRLDDGATLTALAYQTSGGALNLSNMRFSAVRLGS